METKKEVYMKLMPNNCYSIFDFEHNELDKNCISKGEVYAVCRTYNFKLIV